MWRFQSHDSDLGIEEVAESSFALLPLTEGYSRCAILARIPVKLDQCKQQTRPAPSPLVGEGWGGSGPNTSLTE